MLVFVVNIPEKEQKKSKKVDFDAVFSAKKEIKDRILPLNAKELVENYIELRDHRWDEYDETEFTIKNIELNFMLNVINSRRIINHFSDKIAKGV